MIEYKSFNVQFYYQGRTKNVIVSTFTTVWGLKEIVDNKIDVDPRKQVWKFNGQLLEDDAWLVDYNIGRDALLNLVVGDPNYPGGMAPKVRKGDKLKQKDAKSTRYDRLEEIEKRLGDLQEKVNTVNCKGDAFKNLILKMQKVRDDAKNSQDPLLTCLQALSDEDKMALKDKLATTNTATTRYGYLINLLLNPEYDEFGELLGTLQDVKTDMQSTIDFVLEQDGKFQKSFEGVMSWNAIGLFLGRDLLEKVKAGIVLLGAGILDPKDPDP